MFHVLACGDRTSSVLCCPFLGSWDCLMATWRVPSKHPVSSLGLLRGGIQQLAGSQNTGMGGGAVVAIVKIHSCIIM